MQRKHSCIWLLLFLSLFSLPVAAWNALPLLIESPRTLSGGELQLTIGCGFLGQKNFAFSPSSQSFHRDVYSWPSLGIRLGLGKRAELQMLYEVLFVEEDELQIKERWASGDLAFFTRIHIMPERGWRPGLGITLGAKLPNADNTPRIGTDETDLAFLLTGEKQIADVVLNAHAGLLILGDPYKLTRQDDLLAYAAAGTFPVWGKLKTRFEISGQALGTAHNHYASALAHILFAQEHLLWKLCGRVGLSPNSELWGLSGSVRINMTFEPLSQFFQK